MNKKQNFSLYQSLILITVVLLLVIVTIVVVAKNSYQNKAKDQASYLKRERMVRAGERRPSGTPDPQWKRLVEEIMRSGPVDEVPEEVKGAQGLVREHAMRVANFGRSINNLATARDDIGEVIENLTQRLNGVQGQITAIDQALGGDMTFQRAEQIAELLREYFDADVTAAEVQRYTIGYEKMLKGYRKGLAKERRQLQTAIEKWEKGLQMLDEALKDGFETLGKMRTEMPPEVFDATVQELRREAQKADKILAEVRQKVREARQLRACQRGQSASVTLSLLREGDEFIPDPTASKRLFNELVDPKKPPKKPIEKDSSEDKKISASRERGERVERIV